MKARKLHILLVLLCTILHFTVFAQTIIGRQKVDQFPTNPWGGTTYGLTWLPADYNTSTTKYPLIIFLHGSGEAGTGVGALYNLLWQAIPQKIANGWDPVAVNPVDGQTYQFIVVSPQAPGWSYGYPAIQYILNDVVSRYRVDTSRIYFTGLSAGGAGTWASSTNGFNFAKRVAAIVPVSAAGTNTPAEANELPYIGGSYGVKVWTICGTQDSFWPSAVNFSNTINNANPAPTVPVVYTGLPAGHDPGAWNTAYDPNWRNNAHNLNVYEWMLKYTRPPALAFPTANAGIDQNVALPANSVTLNGTASATGGNTIVSYSWTKYSGQACTITNPNSASTTITGLLQGTYVFRLVATDNQGNTAVDDIVVNVLPSASFTPIPALIQAENWYAMVGVQTENTMDAGGGLNVAYIDNGDWMDYNVNPSTAGSFQIRFRIAAPAAGGQLQVRRSDGTVLSTVNIPGTGGWQTWQTVSTTVNLSAGNQTIRIASTTTQGWNLNWLEFLTTTTNQTPVASAGNDQSITLPTNSVTLNGSATDADGSISSYSWARISGPSSYTIVNASSAQTAVNNLSQGVYSFQLTVTDNLGATDTDTVQITVNAAPNISPSANAGSNISINLPVSVVTLNGSGNDPDGSISSYQWTQISGPLAVIATPALPQTLVSSLSQGVYQFELRVTDNNGATGRDTVQVTVGAAPNQPPVANAGSNQTITLPTNSVSLSGSGTDSDGSIANYNWSKIAGPAQFNIASPSQASTTVSNLVLGIYSFELTVTDNNNATGKDTVTVTVNAAANQLPVAYAGGDQTITLPADSVNLNGSATDSDGTISTYQWTKVAGPSSYTIVSSSSAQTAVRNLVAGTYQFELRATDNNGGTDSDTVIVTVNSANNIAPVANAGNDQTITLPLDSVTVTGSGTDTDGTIASYQWTKISGPSQFNIVNASSAQTVIKNLLQGVYSFELTVTDNNSATAKDTIQVTVNAAANIPPTANAGADQTITLPVNSVNLNGSGTDSDGSISFYQWTKISGPSSFIIVNATSAQTAVNNLVQGVYQFRLTVTDNNGATANDTVTVTVNAAANTAPTANAGTDQSITLPTNSVTLNGSGTDADGNIASYQWSKISGPAATITSPNSQNSGVTGLVAGTYIFRLTVTDNMGATGTDDIQITVASGCNGVRRIVTPWSDGGRYFSGKPGNQNYLAYNPGDTLVLRASNNTWSYFNIEDFHGTPSCPVVIINEGGQVKMTQGLDVKHCTNIKITGTGSSSAFYGFYVQNTAADFNGVAIAITGRCKNIEVENVSVHRKTYGAWIKEDGSCIDSLNYPNWWMDNIKMHDCKFVNIGQSAIYAGNTAPTGTRPVVCNGVTTYPIPMRLSNILIYNNIVDSTMRSGIQLGGADSGYNAIYNNIITRCGFELNQQQGTGISIGGMTKNCRVYNNTIRNTFLYGIMCLGAGTNYIENNIIDSSGYLNGIPNTPSLANAIFVDTRQTVPFDSARVIIKNNKIGKSVSGHEHDIFLNQTYNTYAAGNQICGNTKLDGVTPAKFYVQPGINFILCGPWPSGNLLPIANAGYDQVLTLPVNSGILYGSMMELDGVVWYVNWTKISGPAQYTISPPNQPYTWFSNLVQGVYQFEMRVQDNQGGVSRDTVTITVLAGAPNQLPVANAGPDQTVNLPGTLQLNGSGTDADGIISSYLWTKLTGPSQYNIVSPTQAQTTVNNLVAGTYTFELSVTDNVGGIGRDTISVTVNPAPNQPPIADAGADILINLPTNSATLNGSGTDVDGNIISYSWSKIAGPSQFNIANTSSAQTAITNLIQGLYSFELTVMDNNGATGKDTVVVVVNPASNQPPVANAGNNQTITLPVNTVTFNGNGTDADGNIVSYQWTKISGPASFVIVSPTQPQTVINSLVQGVYQFELRVTDNSGAFGRDTVTITVNAANIPPVANAGPDRSVTLPSNSVNLTGSGTDADGSVVSYQWTKISGPSQFTIATPNAAQTTVINLVLGTYQFELTVTDNQNATDKDTVQVIVYPVPNVLPTANAGIDQVITLPTSTALVTGSGTDTDGNIVSYQWSKISGPPSTIGNAFTKVTYINNLVQGVYQFELRVTDDRGGVGRDTMTITVNPAPNRPPVANAGGDKEIAIPVTSVTFNGSGNDTDGSVVDYQWTKLTGPQSFTIVNPRTPQTAINGLEDGEYLFELAVTDNQGAIGRDTVKVTVRPAVKSLVSIYPNPAATTINLKIEAATHRNYTNIKIYDIRGVLVYEENAMRSQAIWVHPVDVSTLTPGAYVVEVGADINNTVKLKFIKE